VYAKLPRAGVQGARGCGFDDVTPREMWQSARCRHALLLRPLVRAPCRLCSTAACVRGRPLAAAARPVLLSDPRGDLRYPRDVPSLPSLYRN